MRLNEMVFTYTHKRICTFTNHVNFSLTTTSDSRRNNDEAPSPRQVTRSSRTWSSVVSQEINQRKNTSCFIRCKAGTRYQPGTPSPG